jgi:hypothetical protein
MPHTTKASASICVLMLQQTQDGVIRSADDSGVGLEGEDL